MELIPGVHWMDRTLGCNVYVIAGERLTLIDAGLPGNEIVVEG